MIKSVAAPRIGRATRWLLAMAVAAAGLVAVDLATTAAPANAASTVGGNIKRSEVLERAKSWVDRGYTYSQTKTAPDPQGKAYRTDCSGLVSMAWHLSNAPNTDVFANSTTDTRWITLTGTNNGADAMRPGDAMVYRHEAQNEGHIEIFAGWKNPARHTDGAWVYSFNSNGETVRWPNANSNFGNLGFDTWTEITGYEKFIKYRYILDDTSASSSEMCIYRALRNTKEYQGPSLGYKVMATFATNYQIYLYRSTTTINGTGTWRRVPDTKGFDGGGGWMNMADWTQIPNYPCEPV